MKNKKYLKDDSYYNDLYDLGTIEECLRNIEHWQKAYEESADDPTLKKLTPEQIADNFNKVISMSVYVLRGERYKGKREAIEKWKRADQARQDKYDNSPAPNRMFCTCGARMELAHKYLEDRLNQPMRVLFTYSCPECKKHKAVYDNGEIYAPKPMLCPKCRSELKITSNFKGDDCKIERKCTSCEYKETDKWNTKKDREKREIQEKADQALLVKYREEFCFADKEGGDYISWMARLKVLVDGWRERDEHKEEYDQVAKIKKLKIADLEKTISSAIQKSGFTKFELSKPEITKHIVVEFSAQDQKSDREDRASCFDLRKTIKKVLADTNWKLVDNSVNGKLGYLSGSLKGYDSEEDLLSLVKSRKAGRK